MGRKKKGYRGCGNVYKAEPGDFLTFLINYSNDPVHSCTKHQFFALKFAVRGGDRRTFWKPGSTKNLSEGVVFRCLGMRKEKNDIMFHSDRARNSLLVHKLRYQRS